MKGIITKSTGLWYEINAEGAKLKARLRGKFKLEDSKLSNPIAVGDAVEIVPNEQVEGEWVITDIHQRKNYMVRVSPRKRGHAHLLACNIDQGVLIITLKQPRTSQGFIDRFLITLEAFRIPGVLLFNKQDLYGKKELAKYQELKAMYEGIGYKAYLTSFTKEKLPNIFSIFEGKTSLLAGHSGAGKSTLINQLLPSAAQEVNEISTFANKGVHTTTFAEMFSIDSRSQVIDTPGIKELGIAEIEPDELSHFFPEMRDLLGECRFHNCLHDNEPGCAVKSAVGDRIHPMRYDSYLSILRNEDNRK